LHLFTYVVLYDIGFAPNPFFGSCTLATCKPGIRKSAQVGDWVAGTGSKQKNQQGKLVFAMEVEEILSFEQYWDDPRFQRKKPNRVGSLKQRYGDNVYHRHPTTEDWIQEDCRHSLENGEPNPDHIRRDTNPARVLIASEFVYYGSSAVDIPAGFLSWDGVDFFRGRGYRRNFPTELVDGFVDWLRNQTGNGLAGEPLDW